MFRILLVEDIRETSEQLTLLLSEEFGESQIDIAETIKQALFFVAEAVNKARPYDVVVLDFKLPQDIGLTPAIDESVCEMIRHSGAETLIVHITAYPDDIKISQHIRDYHSRRADPGSELVSKLNLHWPSDLLTKMKIYLYGQQIQAQIDELFQPKADSDGFVRLRQRRSNSQSTTYQLAQLTHQIILHWDDVDQNMRQQIRAIFRINDENRPIQISLLG